MDKNRNTQEAMVTCPFDDEKVCPVLREFSKGYQESETGVGSLRGYVRRKREALIYQGTTFDRREDPIRCDVVFAD